VKKTRQNKNLEPSSDSIGTEKALVRRRGVCSAFNASSSGAESEQTIGSRIAMAGSGNKRTDAYLAEFRQENLARAEQ